MLTKRIQLFSILGFRVSLDLTWIILAVLITWSLATDYFPNVIDGLGPVAAWWLGAAGALGLFVSIILHEFSHSWIARQFDIPISGITLLFSAAWPKWRTNRQTRGPSSSWRLPDRS